MNWIKKGLIYEPNQKYDWNQSHAQVPVIDKVDEKIWRIYYATRNINNQSNTSYIEVEAGNPANVLYEHTSPVLPLGDMGTFDDSGIMPSSILNIGGKKYLYYIGWNAGTTVSYRLSIGLAISEDNGRTFKKYSNGPIMDRSIYDPCLVASPFVMVEENVFKMWYISGTHWEKINNKPEPFYHIKFAFSKDGINWERDGKICIDYDDFTEGISRPCVLKEKDKYLIFYSFRNNKNYREDKSNSYRLGYARSTNGLDWTREDNAIGIERSKNDWDSEMIAYPYVVEHQNSLYLFYNGNGFGKSGFGYAVMNIH
jgi:predicted GH43/DUF377 family glycosyl hydrolase